jgi:hypothetical protein
LASDELLLSTTQRAVYMLGRHNDFDVGPASNDLDASESFRFAGWELLISLFRLSSPNVIAPRPVYDAINKIEREISQDQRGVVIE